ncbi:MAG: N-acetyltransferase DgcN [Pseudomonadota bacterium]|nr:N-acetyltransferase DgcN [Pseudomonadota bacterium]
MDKPYLLFLGDARDDLAAKGSRGVLDWRPEDCLGQIRLDSCKADLGIADMTIAEAATGGARTMIVGVANAGGFIPEDWVETIVGALDAGMDVAAGMHSRLADIEPIAEAARRNGRQLFDVRHPTRDFAVGKGTKRSGKRLLAVGTDCSCGKMYTTLAIEREMKSQGRNADFRATGQSGIFIAGDGIAVDAVVADFISGAIEWLTPDNDDDHWDIIEGQGSLFHASFAGVSLGLLHGAQPDALVLCHEPTRSHMRGLPDRPLPGFAECMEANISAARLTNPAVQFVGASVDTSRLSADARAPFLAAMESEIGLPCVDPMITGVGRIVDNLA